MSTQTPERELVYCHPCGNEWYRDEGGLTCPRCHSDFVEVRSKGKRPSKNAPREDDTAVVVAGPSRARHVSFPFEIESNNDPHRFHEEAEEEEEEEVDRWAPLGAAGPQPGFGHHMGPFGFPFSNMAPPLQQADRRGDPEYRQFEHHGPTGTSFYTSWSATFNSGAGGGRPPDPRAQTTTNFGNMLGGLFGNILANGQAPARSPHPQPPHPFMRPRIANEPQQPHQVVDPLAQIMGQFFPRPGVAPRGPGAPQPSPQRFGAFPTDETGIPDNIMGIMHMILSGHPMMMGGHGDAAYSQEDFDQIMSQLLEQAQQGGGEPPAPAEEISRIPKINVDAAWLARQESGSKDCSICMEEVNLGDEISELWCGHWYHPFCIKQWLDAHGACPLCRKTLKDSREEWEAKSPKSARGERHGESSRSAMPGAYGDDSQGWPSYQGGDGGGGSSSSGGAAGGGEGGGIRERISSFWRGVGTGR